MPLRDVQGKVYRVVGLTQDITDRIELEDHLRRYAEELNQQVREHTARIRELERQRAEADKVIATGRIAARIAHEINNPLAGIASAFALIKDAVPTNNEYFPYVAKVEREIDRISLITRQMYDVYRPETEQAQDLNVDEIVRDVVALLKTLADTRQVTIHCGDGPPGLKVALPENALRQVLMNVIRNAIEASPAGERVEIASSLSQEGEHEWMVISIADHGSGIAAADRDQIFEPFFTTKNTMPAAGLGLGLSVANSLTLAMGGHIELETEPGRGTTFRIVLPTNSMNAS
jgi:signal transduction histidine kinase